MRTRRVVRLLALVAVLGVSAPLLGLRSSERAERNPEDLVLVFADGFESGNLTEWDSATGEPPGTSLPPDPSTIAPPLDPTIAFDPYAANTFLWTASDPVQSGVTPGAIDPSRNHPCSLAWATPCRKSTASNRMHTMCASTTLPRRTN